MHISITKTPLIDMFIIKTRRFKDDRGFFLEYWNRKDYKKVGINTNFVLDYLSSSKKNHIRGIHYQTPPYAQSKLVRCAKGKIFDVSVDLRVGSPSFGKWFGIVLGEKVDRLVFIPEGFAHGFATLSNEAEIKYKISNYYEKDSAKIIKWNDPDIKINWRISNPIISEADKKAQSFAQYLKSPDFYYND